jgi:hypothetical protein
MNISFGANRDYWCLVSGDSKDEYLQLIVSLIFVKKCGFCPKMSPKINSV